LHFVFYILHLSILPHTPSSALFPYTTLFRSLDLREVHKIVDSILVCNETISSSCAEPFDGSFLFVTVCHKIISPFLFYFRVWQHDGKGADLNHTFLSLLPC